MTTIADETKLATGKLPASLLDLLLADLPTTDSQLLLGPAVGEDAAVIDFSKSADSLLVAKSDPITFATDEIGYYAVNVCANDLAVTGATPRFYLPTVLLPDGSSDAGLVRNIFAQIGETCKRLGIVIAGGHSEITPTVNQPVIAGTLLGTVPRHEYISSHGCQPGDVILLAGTVPVEGTSVIAREKRKELLARSWPASAIDAAANYLYDPGISILIPAHLAASIGNVSAMHDPTEGGIATGLQELALAAGVGLEINLDAIPVPELAQRLCAEYNLDPLGTIASGALLATSAPQHAEAILKIWRKHGWPGAIIGHINSKKDTLSALRHGRPQPFPLFATDEITKLWM